MHHLASIDYKVSRKSRNLICQGVQTEVVVFQGSISNTAVDFFLQIEKVYLPFAYMQFFGHGVLGAVVHA